MAIVVIVFHLYQSDIQANDYFSIIVISSLLLGFVINFLMIEIINSQRMEISVKSYK